MVTQPIVIDAQPDIFLFNEGSTSAPEPIEPEGQRRELAARARSALIAKYAHLEPLDCRSHVHHVASEPND